jgi:hypothetical protein
MRCLGFLSKRWHFGRPIIEYPIGPKRPAPHMSQAFSLAQIKLTSLEIREWALRPLWPNVQTLTLHLLLHENSCARRYISRLGPIQSQTTEQLIA